MDTGSRWERGLVALLTSAYVLLSVSFQMRPPFEAPDEIEHYRYLRTLVETGGLPEPAGQMEGQYHQPPLYYLLNAPLFALLDDDGFDQLDQRLNPHYPYAIGIPGHDNTNRYLHTRTTSESAAARSVGILRTLSLLLGLATLAVSWHTLRLLLPDRRAARLLAYAFIALHPVFAFSSASLNNDNLLILLATGTLYLLLRWHNEPLTIRRAMLLGAICGAALLAKTNALFMGLAVAVAFALNRCWWRWLPLTALTVIITAGGWYARNLLVYGDPLLTAAWRQTWTADIIANGPDLALGLQRLPYAYQTFWARFGTGAVGVSPAIYAMYDALVIAAAAGLIVLTVRGQKVTMSVILCAAFALAFLLLVVYFASTAWSGIQGRYLLPALTVWASSLSVGVLAWLPRRWQATAAVIVGLLYALLSLVDLIVFFLPAYRVLPPQLTAEPIYNYENNAILTGVDPAVIQTAPGKAVPIALEWQALRTPTRALKTFVHLALPDGTPALRSAWRDSYPGAGHLLSEDWRAGDRWRETYILLIPEDAPRQQVYLVLAGLYEEDGARALTALTADGAPVTQTVARLVVHGEPHMTPDLAVRFGGVIGAPPPTVTRTDSSLSICVDWYALADIDRNYHRFIHVLDADGQLIAQDDASPRGGAYPTRYWQRNEVIEDCASIAASAKAVSLAVGWYDPQTHGRLPAETAGQRLPENRWLLNDFEMP